MSLIVIGLGGALGAVARYIVTDWVRSLAGDAFPWGTFGVNVAGSLLIGFALVWLQSMAPSTQARHLIAVGFLGSFTTFSTFSYEVVALARSDELWRAGTYATGSVVLGIVGVLVGAGLATSLLQARG